MTPGAYPAWPSSPEELLDWGNRLRDEDLPLAAAWVRRLRPPQQTARAGSTVRACMRRLYVGDRLRALHATAPPAAWGSAQRSASCLEQWLRLALAETSAGPGPALELVHELRELVELAQGSSVPVSVLEALAESWDHGPDSLVAATEAAITPEAAALGDHERAGARGAGAEIIEDPRR